MPGQVIPIFSKREFDFSNLAASTEASVVVVKTLDVSSWSENAVFAVRVHSNDVVAEEGQLRLRVQVTHPSSEQPETDFLAEIWIEETVVNTNTAPGSLILVPFAVGVSLPAVRVEIKGAQDSTSPNTLRASLSACVSLKNRG